MESVQEIIYLKKDSSYVISLDEYESIGTHWKTLYVNNNNNNVTYFVRFGVKHTPKGVKIFIGNKSIITNIYIRQASDLIMWEYCCIGFIDYMLKSQSFLDCTNISFLLKNMKKV